MLNCIIVDDEHKSRESLRALIERFCEGVNVSETCQNSTEAIDAIQRHRPDLVFLDVQLQKETGFDIIEKLERVDFEIVFTTAYSEYAIKAFKFSAIDYLLKPIDISDLRMAVEKVRKKMVGNMSARMEQLTQTLKRNSPKNMKLAIPSSDGLVFVKVDTIIYCEASGNYTNIYMEDNKKHIVSRTLKEYEDLLDDQDFFRIHNSYLINLNSVKRYIRGEGGQVVMTNDKTLDVAKLKKKDFLARVKIRE
jgi:two-component system, LytTR family, response regulator